MPSPLCQVKDGAGAYNPTTNGNNVTPANTITIDLIDKACDSWSISCLTTDELSVAATVTAALTVNPTTKQATFTAPVAGRTYRFQSQVDGGVDKNGVRKASYTTTFCIYTTTAAGRRVTAADETIEGDPTFGWIAGANDLIRNPPGGFTAGGDLTGTSSSQQVVALTGAAGTLPVATTAALIQWASGSVAPTLRQADISTNSATAASLLVRAQSCTGTTSVGGSLSLAAGSGTSTNGTINFRVAGSDVVVAVLNAAGATRFTAVTAVTSLKYNQADNVTNSATGAPLTIQAQNATGTTATGGGLVLTSGTGTTVAGNVDLQTGGTSRLLIAPSLATWGLASMAATSNARCKAYSDIANVQTTDATVTSLFTWTILDEANTTVTAEVGADKSDGSATASYVRRLRFKRDGGTVTAGTIDTAYTDEEAGFATCDCTIDNSTSTGRVRITGVAATTIDWGGVISRVEVNHA